MQGQATILSNQQLLLEVCYLCGGGCMEGFVVKGFGKVPGQLRHPGLQVSQL
jgi:hypothetical protein